MSQPGATPTNTTFTDKFFKFVGKGPPSPAALAKRTMKASLEADKKRAKQKRADVKKEAKAGEAEILYNDRLARMESVKADLARLRPAADKTYKSLEDAIAGGAKVLAANPTAFDAANKALHAVHLSKLPEEAENACAKALADGRKRFPTLFVVDDELKRHLASKPPLTLERVQEITSEARRHLGTALKPDAKEVDAKNARDELSALMTTMLTEKSAAEAKREQVATKTRSAQALFAKASEVSTAQQLAPMQTKVNSAAASAGEHDYDAADAMLDLVLQDAGAACAAQGPFQADWLKRRGEVPELKKRIAEQHARLEREGGKVRMADAASRLNKLASGLTTLMEELPFTDAPRSPGTLSYKDAIDTLTVTASDIDEISVEIDQYDGFTDVKNGIRDTVRAMFEDARGLLPALEKAVADIDDGLDPKSVSDPFRARLDAAQAEWRQRWPNAFDLASLDADATKAKISAVTAEITAASTDRTARLITDTKAALAADACTAMRTEAKRAIDDLAALDIGMADPLLEKLVKLDARIAKGASKGHYERCGQAADGLRESARGQVVLLQETAKVGRDEVNKVVASVEAKLATFWKAIEDIRDTARRTAYNKLYDTFKSALDTHRAVAKLQQLGLLEETLVEVRTLEKNVIDTVGEFDKSTKDKVLSAVTGGKLGKGVNTATLDDVRQKVANQQERLKDQELRAFAGQTTYELDERLKAITKAIGSATMAELVKQVAEIAVEITAAEAASKTERAAYDAFKVELATTAKLLDDKLFDELATLKKSYQGLLGEARAQARQQGGLPNAQVQHANIKRDIQAGLASALNASGIPTDLAAAQQELVAEQEKKIKQKSLWSGNVTVLEKAIGNMPQGLAAEQESLRDRLAAADKAFKRTADYDAAWAQYTAIRDRVRLVSQNPGGLMMHARGQLAGVRARWVGAVTKLKDGIDTLGTKLAGVNDDPDLTPAIKKSVADELTAVKGLFNAASFDKPVDSVTRPGVDDRTKAAAREVALREVRRMRDIIRNDQRLMMLSQRKLLGTSLAGELSEASLALADMETNMLISL